MKGNIETYICIEDMENLTYENLDLMLGKKLIPMVEKNYPETVFKFYVINNHWFALYVVKLFKPFIPKNTFAKVN